LRKRLKPKPAKKPVKVAAKSKALRKRDKLGRFLPKVSPKPRKKSAPPRDKRGRFLPRGSTQAAPPKYKRDKNGKLRDAKGRFVKVLTKERHYDGRRDDRLRVRKRVTYDEALELYGFEESGLPDWVTYLTGAP
jgi:hypothetical protein